MTQSTLSPNSTLDNDQAIWEGLKQAIADSSGFQQWQEDQPLEQDTPELFEDQVRDYLRDTLETLAY